MFENIGYYREYFVNNKFVGTISCEKDREVIGYCGKQTEIISQDLILSNKKKIKKGTEVVTYLYPLSGRIIK